MQDGRGSPCTLRNFLATGAESELSVSGGEHQHICKVGLVSSGIGGKGFQDWGMCKGTSRALPVLGQELRPGHPALELCGWVCTQGLVALEEQQLWVCTSSETGLMVLPVLAVLAGVPQPSALGHLSPECHHQLLPAPCLSLQPLLCGPWENLGRACGFRGLKCLRGT